MKLYLLDWRNQPKPNYIEIDNGVINSCGFEVVGEFDWWENGSFKKNYKIKDLFLKLKTGSLTRQQEYLLKTYPIYKLDDGCRILILQKDSYSVGWREDNDYLEIWG